MRILHIISSFSAGGAEIYVRDLSRQMVAMGHAVFVAAVSDADSLGRCPDFAQEFRQSFIDAGIGVEVLGHRGRKNPWYGGQSLRRVVKQFWPDVIHSHLYYGLFFKLFSGSSVPLVYTHHNHRLGKGRYFYPLFRRMVSRFVGISCDCTDVLKLAGITQVTTIYNGVSVDRLQVKADTTPQGERLELLAIGTLARQKNFVLLVEAFARLFQRRPQLKYRCRLQIAGEGELRDTLQQQIDATGLSETISLLGNRSDVPQLLNRADLFVMSSSWEGLPVALLEAMLTGVPVIVTDVGGCRDVVELCEAGLVVPLEDAEALAGAIEQLLDNTEMRNRFGDNAREKAQRFSIKTACREHLELYDNVMEEQL